MFLFVFSIPLSFYIDKQKRTVLFFLIFPEDNTAQNKGLKYFVMTLIYLNKREFYRNVLSLNKILSLSGNILFKNFPEELVVCLRER